MKQPGADAVLTAAPSGGLGARSEAKPPGLDDASQWAGSVSSQACCSASEPGWTWPTLPERLRDLVARDRLRLAVLFLLFAGAVLTSRALYLRGKATLAAILIRKAWDETLKTDRPTPPWSWADTFPVARLEIPAIGYDEVVLEGASPRNLAFGPARLMNTAAAGAPGNVVLAGHRTSWFRPLEHVRDGDTLVLAVRDPATGGERRRVYRVAARRVIDPRDTSYLQPTGDDRLTLITCWPFGRGATSPYRFVVQALARP